LLPSGITDNTTKHLDYGIEDSPDGLKSVLVLKAPLPPLSQHPVLPKMTYDEQDKTEDWDKAMDAIKDARRDCVE
jgi:hypothetical protein